MKDLTRNEKNDGTQVILETPVQKIDDTSLISILKRRKSNLERLYTDFAKSKADKIVECLPQIAEKCPIYGNIVVSILPSEKKYFTMVSVFCTGRLKRFFFIRLGNEFTLHKFLHFIEENLKLSGLKPSEDKEEGNKITFEIGMNA